MKVVLTDSALADLEAIGDWIARDNPQRALSFVRELREACSKLSDMPKAWPLVPRYESLGIRKRTHGNYLIFCRVAELQVEIIRVLHGAQDYEDILFPKT
ncbi:MAG: type II toxin-antitoxin system RelE/ParE family toxin [Proteobacteria bacterium]|nr:type II toxin-antitoxin system RelE/ParE family toxin [Pseudomonadota bacterium]